MGGRFFEWAEGYFNAESGRLDKLLSKSEAKDDYTNSEKIRDLSTQKFTDYCKKYAAYHGYEFNPAEYQNSQFRIMREINGKKQEGIYFSTKKTQPVQDDPEQVRPVAGQQPGAAQADLFSPPLPPGDDDDGDDMPF